ncbi:MAG: hypothetical protein ACP5KN_20990 [Armatimonadota bacterium]
MQRFTHHLRSLLTSIGAAAEYMLGNELDLTARTEMLTIIAEQTNRIDGLLDDLTVVASNGGGPNADEMTSVDLYNVARQVVRELAAEAHSLGAWLVLDADGGVPPVVGNRRQLRQLVTATTRSVMRLTRPGERLLMQLRGPTSARHRPSVALSVRVDSADDAISARAEGLTLEDLSLEAARRICEGHGGAVELMQRQPGIVCCLPAAPQPRRPAAAISAATRPAPSRADAS